MKTGDKRPVWDFPQMTERDFRAVWGLGRIVSIEAEWEFASADMTREWLVATNWNGEQTAVPETWRSAFTFGGYASNPGLFGLTHTGQQMAERVREIDAWEQQNTKERAEYERLRRKFEG